MAGKVTMFAFLICFSCLQIEHRTSAALQCNVIEVPLTGTPHRYKNELVNFYFENDSLSIHSRHVSLVFARRKGLEGDLPKMRQVKKQFVFRDGSNELYKVLYTKFESHSTIYLYLYIVSMRHAAPVYLFTNDPHYVP